MKHIEKFFVVIFDFVVNYGQLFLSAISILIAIAAYRRTNTLQRQAKQEPLYKEIQELIQARKHRFSTFENVLENSLHNMDVSKEKENTIKRETRRYFGTVPYLLLRQILKLCKKANDINYDIRVLFRLIDEADPETYEKLKNILPIYQSFSADDEEYKEFLGFLQTVSIAYYKEAEELPGKSYDYLELQRKLEQLNCQINRKQMKLKKCLERAMMKR